VAFGTLRVHLANFVGGQPLGHRTKFWSVL
jgi:hypothetical protein